MFKDQTLFIIGAGASAEFKMPVGSELAQTIAGNSILETDHFGQEITGKHTLLKILKEKYKTEESLGEALDVLKKISERITLSSSIDNFLDRFANRPLYKEVGKLQILHAIKEAERQSMLWFDNNEHEAKLDLSKLKDTWIDSFAKILIEGINHNNIDQLGKHISIICFNYDRCIEFYLIEYIRQAFDIDYLQAHEIVSNITIIHPYGSLGELPNSLSAGYGKTIIPFGAMWKSWEASEKIKIYSEQIEDETVLSEMQNLVHEAKQIVFLGFAFHPQNMKLLNINNNSGLKRVITTGLGISLQESNEIKVRIASLYKGIARDFTWKEKIIIEHDKKCSELFKLHWRNLSKS